MAQETETRQADAPGQAVLEPSPTHFSLVGQLQKIQEEHEYLPPEELRALSREKGIALARIYSIATFYNQFSLQPKGEHIVTVCTGTACHVRGAPELLTKLKGMLSIDSGETTEDGKFTLETVNCLGACALGPLISIDGKYYGKMTLSKLDGVMEEYGVEND